MRFAGDSWPGLGTLHGQGTWGGGLLAWQPWLPACLGFRLGREGAVVPARLLAGLAGPLF